MPPGAGGAGHAFAGTNGFGNPYTDDRAVAGGAAYGDAQLTAGLQGGSGAGGGGNDGDNEEGAGGGGSGGTVYLVAATLHIDGALSATGGLGGRDDYHYNGGARECCNNGGPGSVGRIRLDYTSATLSGTVTPAAGYVSTYLQPSSSVSPPSVSWAWPPCASCELVPCGECQEGCPAKWCSAADKASTGSDSANWCANGNRGQQPTFCEKNPFGMLVG